MKLSTSELVQLLHSQGDNATAYRYGQMSLLDLALDVPLGG